MNWYMRLYVCRVGRVVTRTSAQDDQAAGGDAMSQPNWKPIETAPRDGTCVMVWPPTYTGCVSCAQYDENQYARRPRPYWRRMDDMHRTSASRDTPPTHWAEIPEGPK